MKYLKYFENTKIDIVDIIENDIFVELIDDGIVSIESEENPIMLTVITDDREHITGQTDNIDDLLILTKKKYELLRKLKVAFKKLDNIEVSYQITNIYDDEGYMTISLFMKDFECEYFSIAGKTIVLKKGNIEKDFKCNVGMSSSGSANWINITFKGGDGTNDEGAKEFYDTIKSFKYNGKSIFAAVHGSTGGFEKEGPLDNNKEHPFGEYYKKDSAIYAEVTKRFPSSTRTGRERANYSFGVNGEFDIDW
jgi:hypothetical protein